MNHEQRKKIRKIISFVFIVLIFVGEVILATAVELESGFFNTNNLRRAVLQTEYANSAEEEFSDGLNEILDNYGLPSYIAEKILDDAGIYNRIHSNLEQSYSGYSVSADSDEIVDMFEDLIEPYISAGTIDQAELENMKSELDALCEKTLVCEFGNDINLMINKYKNDLIITIIGALLTVAFSLICLWILYKFKHRAVRALSYATNAATVANLALSITVVSKKNAYLEKYNEKFHASVIEVFYKSGIEAFFIGTGMMAVICIVIYSLYRYLRKTE